MIACPDCEKSNEDHAAFCQVCGAALKPATVQVSRKYGGFWVRFLAWIIDSLIVSAGIGFVISFTFGLGFVAGIVAYWLYEAFMLSSSWKATLGKRALGLVVTDTEGRPLTFAHATGRHFARWLSWLTLCIGFIIAGFTSKKQSLHDMVAGTLVVTE